MAEKTNGNKVSSSKLTLTKSVKGSDLQKQYSQGKKSVKVEIKKTRTITKFQQKKTGSAATSAATSADSDIQAPQIADEKLTEDEKHARLEALKKATDEKEAEKDLSANQPEKIKQLQTELVEEAVETPSPKESAPKESEGKKSSKLSLGLSDKQTKAIKKEKFSDYDLTAKKKSEAKRRSGKLTIAQALEEGEGEEKQRSLASIRRARERAKRKEQEGGDFESEKIIREVVVPEIISVQELANRMAVRSVDVIKSLMKLGVIATASQNIDADTAELVVTEFGHKLKRVSESDVENILKDDEAESEESLSSRPPVVTVMGHVDHGKTSLLDAMRETDVVLGEAGGITQHIGAYQITMKSGEKITFIDTPGHEAFTSMRARGAKVTDIVILVVAADDGIMPQTIEAINHAKAAEVPIIVAINKIDKPEANPDKIRDELMSHNLVPEDFGGDTLMVQVSAKAKTGLDELQEAVLLQAEMLDLKVNSNRKATGTVIEAELDKGKGVTVTLLVQKGTLKKGDIVVAGIASGKIRALVDDKGKAIDEAYPAQPVAVLGFDKVPAAGDEFAVVDNEKQTREITEYREKKLLEQRSVADTKTVEQMFQAGSEGIKTLNIIMKSDVQGSAEAIIGSLHKVSEGNKEVKIKIVHSGAGGITESDVSLAKTLNAIIIGFNVRANAQAKELSAKENVVINYYSIIYEVVDDVKNMITGLMKPVIKETFIGYAEIREVFNIGKVGKVAGGYVTEGIIKRGAGVRLLRDDVVVHEGRLKTLKRFKDDVKEVTQGMECGIAFENYDDIKQGDIIEAFETKEEKPKI